VLHNGSYDRRRKREARLYREKYRSSDLGRILEDVARSRADALRMADIVIPARVIRRMIEDGDSDLSFREGCTRYLGAYLDRSKP